MVVRGTSWLGVAAVVAGFPIAPGHVLGQELPGKSTPPTEPGVGLPTVKSAQRPSAEKLVAIRLLTDVAFISPGEKFHLVAVFDIAPGWHIYWKNSGASGGPTDITVTAPEGFTIGHTLFPRPRAIAEETGMTFGYEQQTALFVEVTAPHELGPSPVAFACDVDWLVCKDICLVGGARKRIDVLVRPPDGVFGVCGVLDPLIEKYRTELPHQLSTVAESRIVFDDGVLRVSLPAQGERAASFFPIDAPGVSYGEAAITFERDLAHLSIPVTVRPENAEGRPLVIAGLIGLGRDDDGVSYEFEFPLPAM